MSTPDKITPADLRNRLESLALKAACFVRGRGSTAQRRALMDEIKQANAALKAGDETNIVPDPETYIPNYLEQGGKWSDIVSAVTRNTNTYGIHYAPQSRKDS
ncbi:hypothetical protein RYZ26_15435 [Terasakiella sp. A23]|uniref:hypothetical protein n=1 Tax=Terasakiella sp. FCG-A23 TaxID=3080561 RepID=UPI0029544143|nr:hypothetical protein [Terasakiella sp. A23]MDV7340998.1 hypothetical protein [Terasakiella sp. A23]